MQRLVGLAGGLVVAAMLCVAGLSVTQRGAGRAGVLLERGARTQELWDNYWPGYRSVRARYQRVKAMVEARNKGLHQKADWDPSGGKNLADPIKFCKDSFPPASFFDQQEFHACLTAIGAKKVNLEVGDSNIVTDITGAPAGRHQPDGPDSLSPGSDGWARN
uniref:Uncharacterized protein n=1 Tax=Hemiselmis andersenii TaxID=464988 RepID=A0A6T8L9D8_HEMAN|mmetsp:Transcript_2890/g.6574  ORF Transcript_2890/g.6574 Transcript_2890/m.6574 type:complete len:162 (-) Transcript_2890:131-616(-)